MVVSQVIDLRTSASILPKSDVTVPLEELKLSDKSKQPVVELVNALSKMHILVLNFCVVTKNSVYEAKTILEHGTSFPLFPSHSFIPSSLSPTILWPLFLEWKQAVCR